MSERFSRLYQLPEEMMFDGCPVIIEAGALLKDNLNNRVLAQLKLRSLSETIIKAVSVHIICNDSMGNELECPDDHQYVDLSVKYGEHFGTQVPVLIPNPNTRSFSPIITAIAFENGTVWKNDGRTEAITLPRTPLQDYLKTDALFKQYRLETNANAAVAPVKNESFWRCSCGGINRRDICYNCGIEKTAVFKAADLNYLNNELEKRLEEERIEAEEKLARKRAEEAERERIRKEADDQRFMQAVDVLEHSESEKELTSALKSYEHLLETSDGQRDAFRKEVYQAKLARIKRKNKRKKTRRILSAIAAIALIIGAYFAVTKFIIPNQKYTNAVVLMNNKDYAGAEQLFAEVETFRNAGELKEECRKRIIYQNGEDAFTAGDYKKAKEVFTSISGFEDTDDRIRHCDVLADLSDAAEKTENKQFSDAIDLLEEARKVGLSEYDGQIDESLLSVAEKALKGNDPDAADDAVSAIKNRTLVTSEFKERITAAIAEKREAEEKAALEKKIKDAYDELVSMWINDSASVSRAEELLSEIPDDYKKASVYRTTFNYYRNYVGTYKTDPSGVAYRVSLDPDREGYEGQGFVLTFSGHSTKGVFAYPSTSYSSYDGRADLYDTVVLNGYNTLTWTEIRPKNTFVHTMHKQ